MQDLADAMVVLRYNLGLALMRKGDGEGAVMEFEEVRTASVNPKGVLLVTLTRTEAVAPTDSTLSV